MEPGITQLHLFCLNLLVWIANLRDGHVEHAVADLLGASLVPPLGYDVSARASRHVHLLLIAVTTLWTLPDELAVVFLDENLSIEAAFVTVVRLRVELRIHDVIVDVADDVQHCVDIVRHVRDLNVGNLTAGTELLELGLKTQFIEGRNLLSNVNL